ncbi:MAG: DNA repair protein RecN, partial [Pseudomonadota bacterium]
SLAAVESGEAREAALAKALDAARGDYVRLAKAASAARRKAAAALENAVAAELPALKLEKTRFAVALSTDEARLSPEGFETVEFQIATNPGAPLGSLSKIASGGELARLVLALKAALAAKEGKTVVIFDEVDAGVGGAVADAVGERLARLAADEQVLVVTHSPQVAARAATQWKVEKTGDETLATSVRTLSAKERVEELARMLAGARITDAAREAAKALLAPDAPRKKTAKKRRAA